MSLCELVSIRHNWRNTLENLEAWTSAGGDAAAECPETQYPPRACQLQEDSTKISIRPWYNKNDQGCCSSGSHRTSSVVLQEAIYRSPSARTQRVRIGFSPINNVFGCKVSMAPLDSEKGYRQSLTQEPTVGFGCH